MKRIVLCMLAAMLMFSACAATQEDPFKVDTVIYIPLDPTDASTEPAAEEFAESPTEDPTAASMEVPTEEPTKMPTEPEETIAKKETSKKNTSNKTGSSASSKNQSSSKKEPAATQPPKETKPAETVPTVTTAPSETSSEIPTEPPAELPYDPSSYSVGNLEYAILNQLNFYRTQGGLPELSLSGRLSGIAYIRAQEVSISWSHTRPDGRRYTSVMGDYSYGYGSASENLLYVSGNGDGVAIVDRWMASDSNSADLLNESFTTAGIGVYRTGGMTYVACLLVG